MNNKKEKDCYNKKKAEIEYATNVTEDVINGKLFIWKKNGKQRRQNISTDHQVLQECNWNRSFGLQEENPEGEAAVHLEWKVMKTHNNAENSRQWAPHKA